MFAELNERAREKPLTWGALIAGVAGALGAIVPLASALVLLGGFVDRRYEERDPSTDRPPVTLRQEMLAAVARIRFDESQRAHDTQRQLAWNLVATLDNKVGGLRGRVNECEVRRTDKAMSRLERDVCSDYASQLRDAERKLANAQDEAGKLSK